MSVQPDTELRDLVTQTLENTGVLAKLRAELRASVFLVLEEHEAFKGRNLSFTNKPLKDFLSTQEGSIILNLIREFLEYFGLEFTASVFEPETQAGNNYEFVGRNKLAHDLKLNPGKKSPLIAQVLQGSRIVPASVGPSQRDQDPVDNLKKDKIKKEEKKAQELNSILLRSDAPSLHANGLIKSPESPAKDTFVENKPTLGLLANSPSSFSNHMKKPESLKLDLNQINLKPAGSSLSCLGGLPPLGLAQINQPSKIINSKSTKQVSSDIKALLEFGSDSPENNYEEDFHASGSEKTSKGTNRSSGSGSEVEEEMSVGMDDHTTDSNESEKTTNDL